MVEGELVAGESGRISYFVKIEVYLAAGLIADTAKMAKLTTEADEADLGCLATATMLMGAAALEAILAEYVVIKGAKGDPRFSDEGFRRKFFPVGLPRKYAMVAGMNRGDQEAPGVKPVAKLAEDYPGAQTIWDVRVAVVHSEPENERSRRYAFHLTKEGANAAAVAVREFARGLWGDEMPPDLLEALRESDAH